MGEKIRIATTIINQEFVCNRTFQVYLSVLHLGVDNKLKYIPEGQVG
jgi:hypothetical protein